MPDAQGKHLPPLPPSKSAWWHKADKNFTEIKKTNKCDHEFVYSRGGEANCKKCHIGFFLQEFTEIKNGHIYLKGELVI